MEPENVYTRGIAREHPDIKKALSRIPWQLVPAVNRIAAEIASTQGLKYETNTDFLCSTDFHAIQLCRIALVSMMALQDYCMDEWDRGLEELVDAEND